MTQFSLCSKAVADSLFCVQAARRICESENRNQGTTVKHVCKNVPPQEG